MCPELPKVNERDLIVQNAAVALETLCLDADNKHAVDKLDLGEVIISYNQITINLLSGTNDSHNDFQRAVEKALKFVAVKYELTIGEQLLLLLRKSKTDVHHIIKWERR